MNKEDLISLAFKAADLSYSPYSSFRVGASLETADGQIFTGTNVENRSYGLTVCAERIAIFKAVSEGHTHIIKLAIACPDADYPVSPCGACRQVISEFMNDDDKIFFKGNNGKMIETTKGEIFPFDSLHELKSQG